MALEVLVRELWNGRKGNENEKGVRTYVRVFGVTTNDSTAGPNTVKDFIPVKRFDKYFDNNGVTDVLGAFAQSIEVGQVDDDPNEWLATVTYSSKTDQPELGKEKPTDRVPQVSWSWVQFQRPIERDALRVPVVNSSGERFDPPPEIDDSRLMLTIVRYEDSFNPATALSYKDAVNADKIFGFRAGLVKLKPITAKRDFENGIFYYEVTYEFEIREEGWKLRLLDQGYSTLDPAGGRPLLIRGKHGDGLAAPVLLNGAGQLLNGTGNINPFSTLSSNIPDDQSQVVNIQAADVSKFPVVTAPTGPGLPSSPPGVAIQIDNEIMEVFSTSGNTLSVKRGRRNTTAVFHLSGANVIQLPVYLEFQPYRSVKFAPLGLEVPLPPDIPNG
jgi:hypothetical protein